MGKDKRMKGISLVKIKPAKAKDEDGSNEKQFTTSASEAKGFVSNVNRVRNLFLRSMAFIYFVAFLSLYLQIDGLYGSEGVTPVKAELGLQKRSAEECFKDKLTILCFLPKYLGTDSQGSMELVAVVGILLSSLGVMCVNCCVAPVMALLWLLYFSLYNVGNVFLWFQWDILLLEAGVLAAISAPFFPSARDFQSKPRDLISNWMIKWLLFRLMFASGVVKLTSGCPTWWGLTALNFHFESQCLPTPLAWYAHSLPSWILKLGVVGTYYVEILVPFAFFAPFSILKKFSFWTQMLLQITIIATGNYNFFNLLTMVLCFSLLDGDSIAGIKRTVERNFSVSRIFARTFSFTLIGLSLYYTWKFFGLSVVNNTIQSKIMFKSIDFSWFVSLAVPYSIAFGFLTLVSTILHAIIISLLDVKGAFNKFKSFSSVLVYGLLSVGIFSISMVPYSSLHKETNQALPQEIRDAYVSTSRYHLTSSYGLFRRMTGTDGGRPEVIIEYAYDLNGPWSEYHFMYKPGNVSEAPTFIVPHQPRLDWQMWFAALSTYHDTPWLVSLSFRLLEGQPAVNALLDNDKLPKQTPKYVRATLYKYKYTSSFKQPTDWWSRKKEKDFLPTYSVTHEPLVLFLKKLGYLEADVPVKGEVGTHLTAALKMIRSFVQPYRPEYVIWSSLLTLGTIISTSKMF